MAAFLLPLLQVTLVQAGTLQGRVESAETGKPVANMSVTVIGTRLGAATTEDGTFAVIRVPAGTYDLQITGVGYREHIQRGVVVAETGSSEVICRIHPVAVQIGGVEIRNTTRKGSDQRQLAERFSSTSITDAVSGESMKSMPSPDVAQVVKRATGVSVMGGDPIIRGLGVRYSKVTMNSSQVAGTEPNRSGVSLELFPASMMQSVKVRKSFQADQQGEFAGGVIDMSTWDFSGKPELSVSYGLGYNSNSTFKVGMDYAGGSTDFMAMDDGTRELPDVVKSAEYKLVKKGRFDSKGYSTTELEEFAEAFPNNWNPTTFSALPNQDVSFTYSDKNQIFGRDIFYLMSGVYRLGASHKEKHQNIFRGGDGGGVEMMHWYDHDEWKQTVALGGLLNFRYDLSPVHSISLNGVLNRDLDDEARFYEGWNEDRGKFRKDTRFRFVVQNVATGQVSGRHLLTGLKNASLTWQFTGSKGIRSEPDTREVQYERSEGSDTWYLADESQSGSRIYNNLEEESTSLDVNWLQPLTNSFNFKVGAAFANRDRNSEGRFFQFEPQSGRNLYTEDPESIYTHENIGKNGILIREATRPTDSYKALQRVRAVYVTTESALTKKLKMIAGVRHESSIQEVTSYELFFVSAPPVIGRIGTGDFLPSLMFIYELNKRSNLRFAASQTVSRPDFRELSEFEYTDIIGGSAVVGNPNLDRALIRNFDLRFEKSYDESNLFSASVFYKHFIKPIEVVIQPTSQYRISYENAKSAGNAGIELEAIQSLGSFNERLKNWAVSANLTLVESTIYLADSTKGVQTSDSRPLHGQSPYVFNLNLRYRHPEWRTQIDGFYNVFGKRITEVGSKPLPDVYELSHPSLDLGIRQPVNANWNVKASLTNILNAKVRFEQGGQPTEEYKTGVGVSVGLSYSR